MKEIKVFFGIIIFLVVFSFNTCYKSNESGAFSSNNLNSSAIKGNGKNYTFDKETDFIYDLTKIDGKDYVVIQGIILPAGFREPEKIKDKDEWRIYDTVTIIIPEMIEGYTVGAVWGKEEDYIYFPPFFSVKECIVSVVLPNTIKVIGNGAFSYSSLTSIIIPDSVIEIGESAFSRSNIKSINLPESLVKIGSSAFRGTNIASIIIPDSVIEIGSQAFMSTPITSVKLPANLKRLGSDAFAGSRISGTVTIPTGVTVIPSGAFRVTNITEVIIPDSVISIEDGAFWHCNELTTVKLPSHPIKYERNNAFENCPKLTLAARKLIQESGYTGSF